MRVGNGDIPVWISGEILFIIAAQRFGFTLPRINELLRTLPNGRTPSKADWQIIGDLFRDDLNAKINEMERLRDTLSGCIGCRCLSLTACALYNPKDLAHHYGSGPRHLMGNRPKTTVKWKKGPRKAQASSTGRIAYHYPDMHGIDKICLFINCSSTLTNKYYFKVNPSMRLICNPRFQW